MSAPGRKQAFRLCPTSRKDQAISPLHIEWSVNEKIAFEVALAASYTGKRSVAVMKQVGLNVAADPFMRTAYLGVVGGMLTLSSTY